MSHDINADPEVWEMRNKFGEWTFAVWLQMLSIADRNEGEIIGGREHIARSLAYIWGTDSRRYSARWRADRLQMVFDWMLDKRWIEARQNGFFIRNHWKYHRTPEQKPAPSEPSEPSEPNIKSKRGANRATPFPEDFQISEAIRENAQKNGWVNLETELEAFRDYHLARGATFKNWTLAFYTWLRNAKRFNANGKRQPERIGALRTGVLEEMKHENRIGPEEAKSLLRAITDKIKERELQAVQPPVRDVKAAVR